jgi:hypothetical protein
MFVALVQQGRESLAYASVLGSYGVRRVRIGRAAATPNNVRDVSSLYCQLQKGISVERLDQYDREQGGWMEVLVEDRHSGPAEIAASRMDFADWLSTLSVRDRRIVNDLAAGERTGDVARKFGVSAGRISQMRGQLKESWEAFGEDTNDESPE